MSAHTLQGGRFTQSEFHKLQDCDANAINLRLQKTNLEIIDHLKGVEERAQALDKENSAARKIIWAAAHSNGGRLEISDDSMRAASDHNNEIASYYDPENQVTVFKANRSERRTDPEESGDR